ncbi:hypothetical protein Desor_3537 [Desulfosporosinus orientis DSM 765]|uniref:DUF1697 domain-containing protein n=1 Tax=Desulfosporosinus orientis (strain ATCC 19365 / DSM 765 / NCIMB 8382 / VKM B-1628 / Singapore I) TaxID=768706 RepID=G7WH06_DESOD|nr:DUF1697 domain-containing protein [Desulfosporosinus orientis]AET69020.1 hypothetical protein Desor_3537 [Desulfosporosinus orientis DSM 765]
MGNKQVALIRGINVGRAKRVAMADLRSLVVGLGNGDVRTILNSGNVVFTAIEAHAVTSAQRIELGLLEKLGVSAKVIVVSEQELVQVVSENPLDYAAKDPSRFLVAFLEKPEDRDKLKDLARKDWAPEALAMGERVAYLWCPNGILKSQLPAEVGRILGDTVTTRNWATVMKLYGLIGCQ